MKNKNTRLNNINFLLTKFLNKTSKKNQIISSIIYKTTIDTFLRKNKIDITPFLISTKLVGDAVIIKTNKPIVNSEILLIKEELIKNILKKFENIGLKINSLNIIFK